MNRLARLQCFWIDIHEIGAFANNVSSGNIRHESLVVVISISGFSFQCAITQLTWDPSTFSHSADICALYMLCKSVVIISLRFRCGRIASLNPIASIYL